MTEFSGAVWKLKLCSKGSESAAAELGGSKFRGENNGDDRELFGIEG